jgi:hypothetical protein
MPCPHSCTLLMHSSHVLAWRIRILAKCGSCFRLIILDHSKLQVSILFDFIIVCLAFFFNLLIYLKQLNFVLIQGFTFGFFGLIATVDLFTKNQQINETNYCIIKIYNSRSNILIVYAYYMWFSLSTYWNIFIL